MFGGPLKDVNRKSPGILPGAICLFRLFDEQYPSHSIMCPPLTFLAPTERADLWVLSQVPIVFYFYTDFDQKENNVTHLSRHLTVTINVTLVPVKYFSSCTTKQLQSNLRPSRTLTHGWISVSSSSQPHFVDIICSVLMSTLSGVRFIAVNSDPEGQQWYRRSTF